MEMKKPQRVMDGQRHDQNLYAKLITPHKGDTAVMQREKERMRRIMAGEDIESKEESIRKLGLARRWS